MNFKKLNEASISWYLVPEILCFDPGEFGKIRQYTKFAAFNWRQFRMICSSCDEERQTKSIRFVVKAELLFMSVLDLTLFYSLI